MTSPMRAYLLQAYLNRELDQLAEEEFELELLRDPELAELALADTVLAIGLNETPPHAMLNPANDSTNVLDMGARRPSKRTIWQLATAAAILAGFAGVLGYQLNPSPRRVSGATLAYIDKQRAIGDQITITLPASGSLVLMIPVASAQACPAEIGLSQSGATYKVTAQADDFGYASVVLAPQELAPGPLTVSVRCEGSTHLMGHYDVLVAK